MKNSSLLMKKLILAMMLVGSFKSFGQSDLNRFDRITRREFKELMMYKDRFLPKNLSDTVVVIRYQGEKLIIMQNLARKISLAKYGTDTNGLSIDSLLANEGLDILKNRSSMKNASIVIASMIQKKLKNKGIIALIVDEDEILNGTKHRDKYWIKTRYTCNQYSLLEAGWMNAWTYLFYDPRKNQDFDIFLPTNYDLMDLIKL